MQRNYLGECLDMAKWSAADIAELYPLKCRRLPQRQRRAGRYLAGLSEKERKAVAAQYPTLRALLVYCERQMKGQHHVY